MIETRNKLTGNLIKISETSKEKVKNILWQTEKGFKQWRLTPIRKRVEILKNLRAVLKDWEKMITQLVREETGKPIQDFLFGEMAPVHNLIKFLCRKEVTHLLEKGEKAWGGPFFAHRKRRVLYEPIGRVAIISSWNFPFSLAIGDSLEALIGGNAVILKPSSYTPRTGLLIKDLLNKVGFPNDIFQVVVGRGSEVGELLIRGLSANDGIALTGGETAGKRIKKIAEQKKMHVVELELGGSNPAIVLEGVNLERAANAVVWGRNMNTGQACNSIKRVYVEASIYKEFVDMVVGKVSHLIVRKDYGPVIHETELNKLLDLRKDAIDKGAQVRMGGSFKHKGICYLNPTILINVNHSMRIMKEECFGPIMPIMMVKDYKEALELANDSPYGLGASIFAKKKDIRVSHLIKELEVGTVNVNSVMDEFAVIGLPFVGRKESGYGSGRHSLEGVKRFLRAKGVLIDSGFMKKEIQWYPYNEKQIKIYKTASKIGLI